jgi:hypothetical protein
MTDSESSNLQRLVDAHPNLFRGQVPRVFSWVPSGWVTIVDTLCASIETALGDDVEAVTVVQIKEKFAGLRFYVSWGEELPEPEGEPAPAHVVEHAGGIYISERSRHPLKRKVYDLIERAEAESAKTCQWCGSTDGVEVVCGGKVKRPRNPSRNEIGPGLFHVSCEVCRGDAMTPEQWRAKMDERRAHAKRKGGGNGE